MSTRSRIGYFDHTHKKYRSIYCHHDGYLSHVGNVLLNYYTDFNKIRRLVALGSISALYRYISPKDAPAPLVPSYTFKEYPTIWKHSDETPAKDVVISYKRDYEEGYYGDECDTLVDFAWDAQEHNYLWKDRQWWWRNSWMIGTDWQKLTPEMVVKK